MTPRHSTLAARLAICGVIAGIGMLLMMIAAVVTSSIRTAPFQIAAGPFELEADEEYVSFIIIIHGDAAWFRKHLTRKAWTPQWSLSGPRPMGPSIDLRKTRGTTVHGRQIRFFAPSWWLATLCFLPALWRQGKAIRARRAAMMEGTCVICGYDLRGSGSRCPECGADKLPGHVYAYAINARMWRRRPMLTALTALSGLAAIAIVNVAVFDLADSYNRAIEVKIPGLGMELDHERLYLFKGDAAAGNRSHWSGLHSWGVEWSSVTPGEFTLALHFIPLVLLLLIAPVIWFRIRRRDLKMIAARSCQHCWFDMQGATGPCPRCQRVR